MSGRTILVIILILVLVALMAFVLLQGKGGLAGFLTRGETQLPVDLARVIPPEWVVQGGAPPQCNFDDDPELEWLVRYRYDLAQVAPAAGSKQEPISVGPWGAVIFDIQTDTLPERPENPGPYRSSELLPYQLLPDFYAGKGQGYLGETSIDIFFVPNNPSGAGCRAEEINVLGYGNAGLPTRISIFRWGNKTTGYRSAHLAGSARILAEPRADAGALITRITTFDRIENHRSILCQVETFERLGSPLALAFEPVPDSQTVDFCYGPPADPHYPEGVAVALLRKHAPVSTAANVPPLKGYLFDNAGLPAGLNLRDDGRKPIPVRVVRNLSSIEPTPAQGAWCTAEQIGGAQPQSWWCGRERTTVEAEVLLNGANRRVVFSLASVLSGATSSDAHWRVEKVELAP